MGREHWAETTLENILISLESGSRPKGGVKGITKGVHSIGAEHLHIDGGFNFANLRYIPTAYANNMNRGVIKLNDILVVKDGATTGKTCFVSEKFPFKHACINEHVFICRTLDFLDKNFIFQYLRSHIGQEQIMSTFHGGAQGGINSEFIDAVIVPLPPINEQQRIVEKLDALLPKVKSAKARLEKIPGILKKFRQSVLAAACSGRLTEDWREGKELPEWFSIKIKEISTKVGSGATPRGGQESYKQKGIPLIRSMNVHFKGINYEGIAFIDKKQADELKNVTVAEDDVLLNITGASIGRVCLAPKELIGARVNQHVCIIRLKDRILPQFVAFYLASPDMQDYIWKENYGATRQALTKEMILNFDLPIPPLEEQHEIVRRVEKLFALADSLEAKYKKAMERVEKIEQAVLAKAFRGELVEPDPNDEPAEVLLKRILEEKAKLEAGKKNRKNKKNKK